MQKELLGYSHAKVDDILLTFGGCDKTICRKVLKYGRYELVNYFNNNDLVKVTSVKPFTKHLYFCEVVRADNIKADFNKFDKPIHVIVGDYDEYNLVLKKRFEKARDFQKEMFRKYKVNGASAFKHAATRNKEDLNSFKKLWAEYFEIKNTPYARHQNFRTTFKVQGKSFESVVIVWKDLPCELHKYVALSRARNKITVLI
jgi:hypothetical protein